MHYDKDPHKVSMSYHDKHLFPIHKFVKSAWFVSQLRFTDLIWACLGLALLCGLVSGLVHVSYSLWTRSYPGLLVGSRSTRSRAISIKSANIPLVIASHVANCSGIGEIHSSYSSGRYSKSQGKGCKWIIL